MYLLSFVEQTESCDTDNHKIVGIISLTDLTISRHNSVVVYITACDVAPSSVNQVRD